MRLNLKDIINVPGACLPFAFELDLSQLEFGGTKPICEPVRVTGTVENHAGLLQFSATASTNLHLVCDRCAKEYQKVKTVPVETMLASRLEGEDNDDIVLLEGNEVDADEIVSTAFILDMDTKNLCSPDCKGLCPGCGADLNVEPCRCKKEPDPRLAVLSKLLDKK